jgi:hypothetical protein
MFNGQDDAVIRTRFGSFARVFLMGYGHEYFLVRKVKGAPRISDILA